MQPQETKDPFNLDTALKNRLVRLPTSLPPPLEGLGIVSLVAVGLRPLYTPPRKRSIFYPGYVALLRGLSSVHWIFRSVYLLNMAHCAMSVLFVGVLRLDGPEEWPCLWGSPSDAYTLQAFWGRFWHRVGSTPMLQIGRRVSHAWLRLRPGSTGDKIFQAFWVFTANGAIHIVADWCVHPDAAWSELTPDMTFLWLNFLGGFFELLMRRLVVLVMGKPWPIRNPGLGRKMLGFLWVLFFFYCTARPSAYPYFKPLDRRPRNLEVVIQAGV